MPEVFFVRVVVFDHNDNTDNEIFLTADQWREQLERAVSAEKEDPDGRLEISRLCC